MNEIITPQQLATERHLLSIEYSKALKELSKLEKRKAVTIIELMAEHKTKSKADIYYDATPDGQRTIELKYFCKGTIEEIRSLKTRVDILNNESFGQY